MAEEDLTLRMNARGARETERDVDRVGRSVRRAGDNVSVFSRAIEIMKTRAVIATVVVAALGVSVAAVVPAVLLLTAAALSFAAIFAPAIIITTAAVMRFKDTVGIAGSAASELSDVLAALKHAFNVAVSPAAAIAMRGFSAAASPLIPVIESFRPVLATFAKSMSAAMGVASDGIRELAPEFRRLFALSAGLLVPITEMLIPLIGAFVDAAIAGIPVAYKLIEWLTGFTFWLRDAVGWMDRFAHSADASNIVADVFAVVSTAAEQVAAVFSDIAGIAYQLGQALAPTAVILGGALLIGLKAVATAIDWVNRNIGAFIPFLRESAPYLAAIVGGLLALKIALVVTAAAQWLLNAAMTANPIGMLIVAIGLLVASFMYAYNHSRSFRDIVDKVWHAIKDAAHWAAVAAVNVKDALGSAFQWVTGKATALYERLKPIIDVMKKVVEFSPAGLVAKAGKGILGHIPGLAAGGVVNWQGPTRVNERGGEIMDLPIGTRVYPHGTTPPTPPWDGDLIIPATFVMPDGTVLAKQTIRAARKKKSTR